MEKPSADMWLREAKIEAANSCGMFLIHNGVVRESAKAKVREGKADAAPVKGMLFDYDEVKVTAAIEKTKALEGIKVVRVWLNRGRLSVGDDIMYVLVGGDIRPHVIDALQSLVSEIKQNCVTETELY